MPEPTVPTLPILVQRRIEAAFAKGVYDEMAAELGSDRARAILARAVVKLAREAGARWAQEAGPGGPDLVSFEKTLEHWTAEDALVLEVRARGPDRLDFDVVRCRYAETYRAMGLADLGAILSCSRDAAFCEGYRPGMVLTRTQTIMGGASHCDFRYRIEPEPAPES